MVFSPSPSNRAGRHRAGKALEAQRLSNRGFGFALTVIALVLVAIRFWLTDGEISRAGLSIAGCLLVASLVVPGVLLPLNRLWTQIAARLSTVTNALLLGLAMYLLLAPLGFLMKGFRRDPLDRGLSEDAESYLVPVMRQTIRETLPDIF